MPSEPVTVAKCRTLIEAAMLAQTLQDVGIHAHVTDQNTEVLGPYSGGSNVRVIVPSHDAAAGGARRSMPNAARSLSRSTSTPMRRLYLLRHSSTRGN